MMKSTQPERRFLTTEFRMSPEGEPATISGYAAVFDSPSEDLGWREEIDPHAFDAVLAKNPDVRCLWNHNDDHVLGRTASGTLRLTVDARGLAYECDLPDTQLGKDLAVSMRRKDITGSSFGFICARDQWTDNQDGSITRRILEISELLDTSPVTFPAYGAASANVRSLPDSMPVEMRSRFEKTSGTGDASEATSKDIQTSSTRSMDDSDGTDGCQCECPQCVAGHCNLCSDDDCDDPECRCYNQRSFDPAKAKMEMRLALLSLKK